MPIAAVRLAQGVGRLIRSTGDKGVVAVLDSRLETARGYGAFLRKSLPPFWYTTRPEVALGALQRLAQLRRRSAAGLRGLAASDAGRVDQLDRRVRSWARRP